jgi:hypothetical protein
MMKNNSAAQNQIEERHKLMSDRGRLSGVKADCSCSIGVFSSMSCSEWQVEGPRVSFMNRELLERSLAQAGRHVIQGRAPRCPQRDLVAKLERDGHDTSQAIQLLRQFQELQALHIADRDRLRKLLGLSV